MGCPENGIIFGTAMAEKRLENSKVRYSAAYPTGRERIAKGTLLPWGPIPIIPIPIIFKRRCNEKHIT